MSAPVKVGPFTIEAYRTTSAIAVVADGRQHVDVDVRTVEFRGAVDKTGSIKLPLDVVLETLRAAGWTVTR